jgi:hypothetical protein
MADTGGGRDMMGSKADMISFKIPEVARQQIFAEFVNKANARIDGVEKNQFQVNPRRLPATVCTKETNHDPTTVGKNTQYSQEEIDKMMAKLNETHTSAATENEYRTSAMENGALWKNHFEKDRNQTNQRWNKSMRQCDETKYANAYTESKGESNFEMHNKSVSDLLTNRSQPIYGQRK